MSDLKECMYELEKLIKSQKDEERIDIMKLRSQLADRFYEWNIGRCKKNRDPKEEKEELIEIAKVAVIIWCRTCQDLK